VKLARSAFRPTVTSSTSVAGITLAHHRHVGSYPSTRSSPLAAGASRCDRVAVTCSRWRWCGANGDERERRRPALGRPIRLPGLISISPASTPRAGAPCSSTACRTAKSRRGTPPDWAAPSSSSKNRCAPSGRASPRARRVLRRPRRRQLGLEQKFGEIPARRLREQTAAIATAIGDGARTCRNGEHVSQNKKLMRTGCGSRHPHTIIWCSNNKFNRCALLCVGCKQTMNGKSRNLWTICPL
jgi:hypothetical protein